MRISVANLFGKNGCTESFSLEEMPKDAYPDVVDFVKPVSLHGTVTNEKEQMLVSAEGNCTVHMACARCLAPVEQEITFSLDERFVRTGTVQEETETFSGDQMDLSDIVRRSILGALPMKVLCKEDCKGLCPKCGKNLNEGECGCDTSHVDPRFESLRALFNLDEEV